MITIRSRALLDGVGAGEASKGTEGLDERQRARFFQCLLKFGADGGQTGHPPPPNSENDI